MANPLLSLAVLKVNWDTRRKDHIDNFVPFVVDRVRARQPLRSGPNEVRQSLAAEFVLNVPVGVVETVLRRAGRDGLIVRENDTYRVATADGEVAEFARARQDASRQYSALLDGLVEFRRQRYRQEWSKEAAENALAGYLDSRSPDLLGMLTDGRPLPAPPLRTKSDDVVISSFIQEVIDRRPDLFGYF